MHSKISTMVVVTGLASFSQYASAWNHEANFASGEAQGLAQYAAANQYHQANYYPEGRQRQRASLYPRANQYPSVQDYSDLQYYPSANQQASAHRDFQSVQQQSFSSVIPKHNSLSAERKLALYARALDMDIEELIARGKTTDKIKSVGKQATKMAGKAANILGKAANIGKKVFGRDEMAAWEDADLVYLAARDAEAEPEPEPELWVESDGDVYGWD